MIRPSFSAVDQFVACERRLYYEKIAKIPQPASHYLCIGNFYHAVIAYVLAGYEAARTSFSEMLSALRAKERGGWAQDVSDDALCDEVGLAVAVLADTVFPHIKARSLEQWAPDPHCAKIDVLSEWTPIAGDDGVAIGHTEEPCVIDWKTAFGRSKPHRPVAQLAHYCIATGTRNAGFCEVFRDGTRPRLQMTRFDDYDLRRWKTYFDQQFAAMASRGTDEANYKLAAPDHPLCSPKFCGHWKHCPRGEGNK